MSQQAGASSASTSYAKYASLPDVDTSAPDVYEYEGPSRTDDATPAGRRTRSRKHRAGGADAADSDSSSDDSDQSAGHRKHAGDAKGAAAGNDDIDSSSLKRSDAASKFTGATDLDVDAADFSGRLPGRRSRKNRPPRPIDAGLETTTYVLDGTRQAGGQTAGESAVDRLRRLRFEASQLEEELKANANGTDGVQAGDDADQVDGTQMLTQLKLLQDQLAKLPSASDDTVSVPASRDSDKEAFRTLLSQIKQAPSALTAADASALQAAGGASTAKTTTGAAGADAVQLEARLHELETTLGVHEALLDESRPVPRPVLPTLARLEHQLSLLSQPRHLDAISRRVKVLVTEMDRANEMRRKLSAETADVGGEGGASKTATTLTPAEVTKLQHLFGVSTRIEPLLPLVPSVLERLQSLAELHASAAHFGSVLDELEQGREERLAQQQELDELLRKMETNMQHNSKTVEANLAALQQRIEDVSARMRKLSR